MSRNSRLNPFTLLLTSNCAKYMAREGCVYISVNKEKENLPLLFNRFYRVDKSRNSSTVGTGLGLAIVKSIVEEHRGEVTVESIYGKGTKFTISLPLIL